jgi:hypothetical protein
MDEMPPEGTAVILDILYGILISLFKMGEVVASLPNKPGIEVFFP